MLRSIALLRALGLTALLLGSLAWSPAVRAQDTAPLSPSAFEHRVRLALPAQLAVTTAATLAVTAGSTHLAIYALNRDKEGGSAMVLLPALALIGPGLATSVAAGTAQWMGRLRGVEGSYWRAWGYGLVGVAVGTGVGCGVWAALPASAGRHLGTAFLIGTYSLAAVLGTAGAVYGYNSSARRRFERLAKHASPSLGTTSDQRGVMLSVHGTF